MIFCGIDPGLSGAVAFIGADGAAVHAMPIIAAARGRSAFDIVGIRTLLMLHGDKHIARWELFVTLEKGQPLPASMGGGIANFARGYSRGLFEGLFVALGLRYQLVAPRTWQAVMLAGTSGSDTKQRSIVAASRLFPSVSLLPTPRSKKPSDGFADALLLAEYSRRSTNGSLSELKDAIADQKHMAPFLRDLEIP